MAKKARIVYEDSAKAVAEAKKVKQEILIQIQKQEMQNLSQTSTQWQEEAEAEGQPHTPSANARHQQEAAECLEHLMAVVENTWPAQGQQAPPEKLLAAL